MKRSNSIPISCFQVPKLHLLHFHRRQVGKVIFIFFLLSIPTFNAVCQTTGQILIVSNSDAFVIVDGEDYGEIKANKPSKIELSKGEHYLQVLSKTTGIEKNEILNIESGKLKVLKYEFENTITDLNNRILIVDLDFNIPGIVTATAQEDFEYPTYLYAFEKGDNVVINLDMANAKGTNLINVFSFPDGNSIYSNDSFTDLEDLKIGVKERSIYGFTFGSNHAFDRDARLLIERVPESVDTKSFNSKVSWQEIHRVEVIQKPQKFFINSGSNATFKGGKSRTALPIRLPENTVKWYYEFSASRNESEIDDVTNTLDLAGELSSLLDHTGVLELGISLLNQPPGSDYCDIYLIDHNNYSLFLNKQQFLQFPEGTRENLKSGIIEIKQYYNSPIYLGLKNPHYKDGVHVVVEVAAVVKEEGWVMHHKD